MAGVLRNRFFLLGLGLITLAVALYATITPGDVRRDAAAASSGPEIGLSLASGGACVPNVSECTVLPGSQFVVSIDAVSAPAQGYAGVQAWVAYGDVLGDQSAGGAIKSASPTWPDCEPALYLENNTDEGGSFELDSYYVGCLTDVIPPFPVSTHEGSLFTFGLTCPPYEWDTYLIDLVPLGTQPAGTSGTSFFDENIDPISTKISPLTIHCQDITATPPGNEINGTLYESQSGFMRGATVTLEPLGSETTTSIQDGSFTFLGVPDGSYTIVVKSPGCTPFGCYYPFPVIVSGGKVSVSIYPKPGDGDTDGDTILNDDDLDDDNDGCPDARERGTDPLLGGFRNPHDPYDFYDVGGPGGGPKDGVVELFADVLQVIGHFSPLGQPPYDVAYDRGPSAGPSPWNMTAPDGKIELFVDVLGVIGQVFHDCR